MIHWVEVAVRVYILHMLVGNGYQFWSGAGSDLAYLAGMGALLKHVNCEEPRCLRPGHRHPGHGRPVCRRHYHSDVHPPAS